MNADPKGVRPDAEVQADDQAPSEAFDEEKHAGPSDQRRPHDGAGVKPLDGVVTDARGEVFGELREDGDEGRTGDPGAPEPDSGVLREAARATPKSKAGAHAEDSEKIDEAMEQTFPASDPPPWRPGSD